MLKSSITTHAAHTDVDIINKTSEAGQTEGVVVSQKRQLGRYKQQTDTRQQETCMTLLRDTLTAFRFTVDLSLAWITLQRFQYFNHYK